MSHNQKISPNIKMEQTTAVEIEKKLTETYENLEYRVKAIEEDLDSASWAQVHEVADILSHQKNREVESLRNKVDEIVDSRKTSGVKEEKTSTEEFEGLAFTPFKRGGRAGIAKRLTEEEIEGVVLSAFWNEVMAIRYCYDLERESDSD